MRQPARVSSKAKGAALKCHAVNDAGGSLGPDLSWIGILRTPESLKRSLVDPADQISRRYFTLVVETRDGKKFEGLALNEDDFSIQLRDTQGELRSFRKDDLKDLRREPRSLMPAFGKELSAGRGRSPRDLSAHFANDVDARARDVGPRGGADDRERALLQQGRSGQGGAPGRAHRGPGHPARRIGRRYRLGHRAISRWRLAEKVGPQGKVYAVDVQQSMLDETKKDGRFGHKLANVEYDARDRYSPGYPSDPSTSAFLAYAYHEFAEPEETMLAIRRALKPGGRVMILEYAKESKIAPASPLHKMSFEEIRREIEPLGFAIDQLLDFLPVQHGVIFTIK